MAENHRFYVPGPLRGAGRPCGPLTAGVQFMPAGVQFLPATASNFSPGGSKSERPISASNFLTGKIGRPDSSNFSFPSRKRAKRDQKNWTPPRSENWTPRGGNWIRNWIRNWKPGGGKLDARGGKLDAPPAGVQFQDAGLVCQMGPTDQKGCIR